MSQIQTGRYEQFTRRLLRLVGGSIMPLVQNDLSPVLNIEDPSDQALFFWRGHKLASAFIAGQAPDAGEFAALSLFNPLGSGKLLVLLNHIFHGAAGVNIHTSFSQTRTLNVESTLSFNDTRASLVAVPSGEIGNDSFVAVPTAIYRSFATTATAKDNYLWTCVLAPGVGVFWTATTADVRIDMSLQWLERDAEITELETL